MELKFYNTLGRKLEEFKPLKKGKVGLYACGLTVYNYAHIGNLRTYVFEDILKRVLLFNNYQVKHVVNITDVGHLTSDEDVGEDKMEEGAKREGKNVWDIAKFYTQAFKRDLERLNVLPPDIWCKATDHIKEQIDLVRKIEKKGFTYRLKDGVYFDTLKLKNYGALAKLDVGGLKAGARVDVRGKKNITDFALWKFSPQDKRRQMEWDSPWGKGFPGWHIECAAMAMKYLGENFDIHCGGMDHIPVHHTNEIAQVEAVIGKNWVNFWLHGEFLVLEKEKMAKSTGNFITLDTLIKQRIDPSAYRYFLLNAHYRSPLVFNWDIIKNAERSFQSFKKKVMGIKAETRGREKIKSIEKELAVFKEKINNDLNIPQGLAYVWKVMRKNALSADKKYLFLKEADRVLGLDIDNFKEEEIEISAEIEKLIQAREEARRQRDFKRADQIRNEILKRGIILEDTSQGIRWRKK